MSINLEFHIYRNTTVATSKSQQDSARWRSLAVPVTQAPALPSTDMAAFPQATRQNPYCRYIPHPSSYWMNFTCYRASDLP